MSNRTGPKRWEEIDRSKYTGINRPVQIDRSKTLFKYMGQNMWVKRDRFKQTGPMRQVQIDGSKETGPMKTVKNILFQADRMVQIYPNWSKINQKSVQMSPA